MNLRERENLQEWLAKHPAALGDLLIIQKEFASWDSTKERLDLLALDRSGRLVVIENKLDDSGRDVTWQALKYAAYCSTLKTAQIVEVFHRYRGIGTLDDARAIIAEFLGEGDGEDLNLNPSNSQRIILVAAHFRPEVTATALWLLGRGVSITCFQVTPFSRGDDLFLTVEQIIPTPEASDYMVRLAEKSVEQESVSQAEGARHLRRRAYWAAVLAAFEAAGNKTFANKSPSPDNWMSTGAGTSGLVWALTITESMAKVQFNFERPSPDQNRAGYDSLAAHRDVIDTVCPGIDWQRPDPSVRTSCKLELSLFADSIARDNWPDIIEWQRKTLEQLQRALAPHLAKAKARATAG